MARKQNIVSIYLPPEMMGIYTKFLNILEVNNQDKRNKHRSKSDMIAELIKKYVEEYERTKGPLVLKEETTNS